MTLSIEDKTLTSAQKSLIFQNMLLTYKLTTGGNQTSRTNGSKKKYISKTNSKFIRIWKEHTSKQQDK